MTTGAIALTAAVAALGGLAVWLNLPRRRPVFPTLRWASAAVAMVLAGLFLLETTGEKVAWYDDVLFFLFAAIAVVSGFQTITRPNPVWSALWFAMTVLATCGLFLMLNAAFLAAATVIVYAGAIVVTLLFVLMMAQQHGGAPYDRESREPGLACIAGFGVLVALLIALQSARSPSSQWAASSRHEATLDQVATCLDAALEELKGTSALDEVSGMLYVDPGRPETAVGNLLMAETNALPKTERGQVQAHLNGILQELGRSRLAGNRARFTSAVGKLRAVTEGIRTYVIGKGMSDDHARKEGATVAVLGLVLLSRYLWAIELGGTLLLLAAVGAIVIAKRKGATD